MEAFHKDEDIRAIYGFSGGAYNTYWILQSLKKDKDDIGRIDLVVVLGIDEDRPESHFDKSNYKGAHWELVYRHNPPGTFKLPKKKIASHMFGPEWLLWELDHPKKKK